MNQNIDKFDGSNKIWNRSSITNSQVLITDGKFNLRLEKYIEIGKLFGKEEFNSCSVDVEYRIGSESTKGEVYKTKLEILGNYISNFENSNEVYMATKILPILNDKSIKDNENEIKLALEASRLVLKGESIYFPIVYNFAICEETNFYNNKDYKLGFYERSLRYQQFRKISSIISEVFDSFKFKDEALSKIVEYKRSLKSPEFVINYIVKKLENDNISNKNDIQKVINLLNKINFDIKISSHLLFSEIASYDLNYYLNNFKLSYENLYDILYKIFYAINDLHTKLNILHNDLHLGNILILEIINYNEDKDNEEFENSQFLKIPLIHDFGSSRKINFENLDNQERIKDILYFMGQFRDRLKDLSYLDDYSEDNEDSIRIIRFLDEIDDILLESKNIYPIQDVIEYIESLEI